MAISIEEMAVFCKKKGFVFSNSEIYGGMAGFFDYGPLGVELKNNIKQLWWKRFVQERDDVVGIDGSIVSNPKVWVASGHVGSFADVLVECKKCKQRFRADHLIEDVLKIKVEGLHREDFGKLIKENNVKCLNCKGELSEPNAFNLMFKTYVGPVESEANIAYLRPETAQQMFTNFKLISEVSRVKLPFGIAQIGRAFRNEISPRDFLFRSREFEQMEIEYFLHPEDNKCKYLGKPELEFGFNVLTRELQTGNKEHVKIKLSDMVKKKLLSEWHAYWLMEQYKWFLELGLSKDNLRLREHMKDELAHYSSACFDIEYNFPFGWKEIHGNADRGQFDLRQHENVSGKKLEIFDEESKKSVLPKVIEPSQGVDRAFLAFMFEAYNYDEKRENVVLKLHKKLTPIKLAVFPLVSNKEDIVKKAKEVYEIVKCCYTCYYDTSGSVGRRYSRADESGVLLCITIDYDSLKDDSVTLRDRDTTKQIRVKISDLQDVLYKFWIGEEFEKLGKII